MKNEEYGIGKVWMFLLLAGYISTLLSCSATSFLSKQGKLKPAHDCHVHIMSPTLIADWKAMGIPFSRPDHYYADIDSIIKNVGTSTIDLIAMAHVYTSEEFYQGSDGPEKLAKENDYVLSMAAIYPRKVRPFISVDPLRHDAIGELKRCYAVNNNIGLKMHNSASQIYLTVPAHVERVKSVFMAAAEMGIPVLMHFDNWHPKFGARDLNILVDSILAHAKPMVLTIPHFGTSGGFSQKTKDFLDGFIALRQQGKIPGKHKIYLDISAVALDKDSEGVTKLNDAEFAELKGYITKIGAQHIVFGTDYPLYTPFVYAEILRGRVGLKPRTVKQLMKPKG
ncbi:MAG: amidohydrolase family protein [Saprospiraceae bacterium]|nr:amidohydrolase family protein [Saprospiraceae bacterium]